MTLGATVLVLITDGVVLALPDLLSGLGIAVPVAFVVPLSVAVVVAWSLQSGDGVLEAVAVRRVAWLDAVLAACVASIALALGVAASAAGSEMSAGAARNAVGYVGMALIGRGVVGSHAAPLVPSAFVLFAALFGAGQARQPQWWAWPMVAADVPMASVMAAALLVVGVAVTATAMKVSRHGGL